jgi:hypothetical protein
MYFVPFIVVLNISVTDHEHTIVSWVVVSITSFSNECDSNVISMIRKP